MLLRIFKNRWEIHFGSDPATDAYFIIWNSLLREKLQVGGSGWNATGIDTRTVNQTEWLQVLNECYRKRLVVAGHKTPTSIELIFPGDTFIFPASPPFPSAGIIPPSSSSEMEFGWRLISG